jgi:hypothetical protein
MKERPILMSAPMIRVLLSGAKTQTRRLVLPGRRQSWLTPTGIDSVQRFAPSKDGWWTMAVGEPRRIVHCGHEMDGGHIGSVLCPYGVPGDRLWVRHRADLFSVYFKPIPGWEGLYAAGTDGLVYRMDRREPEPLKGSPASKGYLTVSLSRGQWETHSVHKLVCEAYYGPAPFGGAQVRHVDGIQTNNAPENLDWGTQEQNWQDRKAHGRGMGADHHAAKLADHVEDIRRSAESQRALAAHYEVSQSTIQAIRAGRSYGKHEPAPRNLTAFKLWRSPLFMPRWASRITLEITDVRVERLQDIGEEDACAEGVAGDGPVGNMRVWSKMGRYRYQFADLWDAINGKRATWASNPWVFVVAFRKVCP